MLRSHWCFRCLSTAAQGGGGPLRGVKVLDLTRILAGPFATQGLGDMGADVVKVERPGSGDETRRWGPPFTAGESTYFLSVNRNKRSVEADLKTDEGREFVLSIAKACDVLVENYLPGKLAAMGLGYDDVRAVNPGIIYASVTGFGDTGPYASLPAYDVAVAALGGLMSITGPPDGPPVKVGVAVTDILTGVTLQSAICAALFHRERTGEGQHVQTSLLETQVACLANVASSVLIAGTSARRWGTAHESIVPYQTFACSDGDVMVAAMSDEQFRRLCTALCVDLAADERFATNASRVAHRDTLLPLLAAEFKAHGRDHWVASLRDAGLTVAPVNSVREALDDPQVRHRGMVQEVEHPVAGRVPIVGHPVRYSATPACATRRPPPLLGEHTAAVMEEVAE